MSNNLPNHRLDVAWAAGFIDGEGCVGIYGGTERHGSYGVSVTVAQVDPRPLHRLQQLFGGTVKPFAGDGGKRRDYFRYTLNSRPARSALAQMLPYLVNKREQAEIAIQMQDRMVEGKLGAPYRLTDEEKSVRADMAQQVRDLKRATYVQ